MRAVASLIVFVASGCTLVFGGHESNNSPDADVGTSMSSCVCVAPPMDYCADSSTLRTYLSKTFCASGACEYAYTDVTCPSGCADGACVGADPCSNVTCDSPPDAYCSTDGTSLVTFTGVGTCNAGVCAYAPTTQVCAYGCDSAQCQAAPDPCADVTCNAPPASSCLSSSTLVTYASTGTCNTDGSCSYASTQTSCANGCSAGACLATNACTGVTCDTPPATKCHNSTTLAIYDATGTCSNGTCSYHYTESACPAPTNGAAVCTSGTCGFSCNSGYTATNDGCVASTTSGCGTVTAAGTCTSDSTAILTCVNSAVVTTPCPTMTFCFPAPSGVECTPDI